MSGTGGTLCNAGVTLCTRIRGVRHEILPVFPLWWPYLAVGSHSYFFSILQGILSSLPPFRPWILNSDTILTSVSVYFYLCSAWLKINGHQMNGSFVLFISIFFAKFPAVRVNWIRLTGRCGVWFPQCTFHWLCGYLILDRYMNGGYCFIPSFHSY